MKKKDDVIKVDNQGNVTGYQEKAAENYNEIRNLKNIVESSFLMLGKKLKENRDKLYWKQLGFKTFEAFIGSPEISLHRTNVYRTISVYEGFIEKLGIEQKKIEDVSKEKLHMILPVCNKENVDGWIEKARNLSRSDLRLEVQGNKGQKQKVAKTDWREVGKTWLKTQPVSKWGEMPLDTVYGQYVANVVNYFSKKGNTVVNLDINDSVVNDVCDEFEREYVDVVFLSDKEGKFSALPENDKTGDLAISFVGDPEKYDFRKNRIIDSASFSLKGNGKCAVFFKKEIEEYFVIDFINYAKKMSFDFVTRINIYERPSMQDLKISTKDNKLIDKNECVLIFNKL